MQKGYDWTRLGGGLPRCVLACMHAEVAPNQHLRVQNPNMDTEGRYSVPTPCPPLCSNAWENAIEGWPALLLQEGQALKGEASYVRASDLLCRPLRPRRGFQVGVSGFGYGPACVSLCMQSQDDE